MSRAIRRFVATALAASFLAACGGLSGSGTGPGSGGIRHPVGADQLVLRIATAGGFIPPDVLVTRIPDLSLFGDGTIVATGPMTEIYPGAALANLLARTLTEQGMQRVLRQAAKAGLLGPDRTYATMTLSDMPTTVFTLVANGRRHVVSVYGLGAAGPSPDMPAAERDARKALLRLETKLLDLSSWLPARDLSAERSFVPHALRLFVRPYRSLADPNLTEPPAEWPLAGPLTTFGRPARHLPGARCGAVQGDDARRVLSVARRANQLTPWVSRGRSFGVTFRPLLPEEQGCAALKGVR
jgi:hypothetical protein